MNITNRTFRNEDVRLDSKDFEGCTFIKCRMVFGASAPVSFSNCTFDAVQWVVVDAARLTIEFMTALHRAGGGGRELIEKTFDKIRGRSAPPTMEH